jgi:tRNA modification GTPase
LTELLTGLVAAASSTGEERAVLTRARHREAVGLALAALDRGLVIGHLANPELLAEEVRSALASVGQITGHVGVEAVLDRLFSEFCIGK